MGRFSFPNWVKQHNELEGNIEDIPKEVLDTIINDLKKFRPENPEVSIVIPAYNEEKNILKTLSSLSKIKTNYPTEILVINNNSKDRTQEILDLCGVRSILETRQGISFARRSGLEMPKENIC